MVASLEVTGIDPGERGVDQLPMGPMGRILRRAVRPFGGMIDRAVLTSTDPGGRRSRVMRDGGPVRAGRARGQRGVG